MNNILYLLLTLSFQLDPNAKAAVVGALNKLNHFRVEFAQETYSDFFDETSARGTLSVARPGKMRMDYSEGEDLVRIWDGKVAYEHDLLADSESRLEQAELKEEPVVKLLLYGEDIDRLFLIDRFQREGVDVFRLRPRKDDSYHVEIVFDKKMLPTSLEIVGADGEGTHFQFSSFDLNPQFLEDTFLIPPPPNP